MTRPLLLTILLAGCAAPSQGTYGQAAPAPFPAPPMAPAGRGAPMVGQPGAPPAQEYPRSPYARPLPPTKEPGLWSAEAPQASGGAGTVLDVLMPKPRGGLEDMMPTLECAQELDRAAREVLSREAVAAMSTARRQCLAARLMVACTGQWVDFLEEDKRQGHYDAEKTRRVKAAHTAAQAFEARSCAGQVQDPQDPPLVRRIMGQRHSNIMKELSE